MLGTSKVGGTSDLQLKTLDVMLVRPSKDIVNVSTGAIYQVATRHIAFNVLILTIKHEKKALLLLF